jgi:hypothetical protein
MGAYHGRYTFLTFSHAKSILVRGFGALGTRTSMFQLKGSANIVQNNKIWNIRKVEYCVVDPDPGSGMGEKTGPDPVEQPESYFRGLKNQFFGLKYFKIILCGSGIRDGKKNSDPGWKNFGSGMEKIRRDPR